MVPLIYEKNYSKLLSNTLSYLELWPKSMLGQSFITRVLKRNILNSDTL